MSDSFWLFAYGSLKPGECNYHRISGRVQQAFPARASGRLHMRADGYPALAVPGHVRLGSANAVGDLEWAGFEIATSPPTLSLVPGYLLELVPGAASLLELDTFEDYTVGEPSEYLRVLLPVFLEDGRALGAWVYVCEKTAADWPVIEVWPPPGQSTPAPYRGLPG